MHVKFRIKFADGSIGESHDESWNDVRSHSHFLPPNCDKKWIEYSLITDDPKRKFVTVNFLNGLFNVNGTHIHPAVDDGDVQTFKTDPQTFPVSKEWEIFNGYPYFPVVGKRNFMGDWGQTILYFAGWKRKLDNKTIQKLCFIYPNGQIVLT